MRRSFVPTNVARVVTGTTDGARDNLSIPSSHPRMSFSLSDEVKDRLSPVERTSLCESLAPHYADAHRRWPGNEISVEIDGVTYRLCAHLTKPNKVRVSY
jgi:hypothetical protein